MFRINRLSRQNQVSHVLSWAAKTCSGRHGSRRRLASHSNYRTTATVVCFTMLAERTDGMWARQPGSRRWVRVQLVAWTASLTVLISLAPAVPVSAAAGYYRTVNAARPSGTEGLAVAGDIGISAPTAGSDGAAATGAVAAWSTFMRRHLAASSVSVPLAPVHTSRLGRHWPTRITFSALDTWSVSLASTVTDRVALTATSNLTVTGSGYLIQIYDLTTNTRVTSCSSGTTCNWSGVPSTAQDAYVAVVGSSQTTYPPTTVVATSQTVTPPAWTVSLALSGTTSPVLTATDQLQP
jgi:hypothetical protein